jgi:hypothetical protein
MTTTTPPGPYSVKPDSNGYFDVYEGDRIFLFGLTEREATSICGALTYGYAAGSADLAAARAENKRLSEALKPFADRPCEFFMMDKNDLRLSRARDCKDCGYGLDELCPICFARAALAAPGATP